jgi:hypothetical protein
LLQKSRRAALSARAQFLWPVSEWEILQRQSPKLLRISYALGSKHYEDMAQRHTEFGHARFVVARFLGPYHRPGGVKCSLNGSKHEWIRPCTFETPGM